MPENYQLQQNNLVQNQQPIEETKKRSSWFSRILGFISFLLGIGLIGLGIYDLKYFSDYPIEIFITHGTRAFFPVGIIFTIIGVRNLFLGVDLRTSWLNFKTWVRNLFLRVKLHTSWSNLILSVIFGILGIGIIVLALYEFLSYDWNHDDLEDYLELGVILLISILIIFTGVLTFYNNKVEAYYHPTWLTKILSGFLRFLGISLIRSGLRSFSLIPSENYTNGEILLAGGSITLCGIGFIVYGILLYCTKKLVNMGVTFLLSIVISIGINWALDEFWHDFYRHHENDVILFNYIFMLYSLILSIIWGVRCFRLKKRGKINGKILNKEASSKKIGYITTGILLLILIGDTIYGKIQWSKIPEIDESVFKRDYHQTKLPDEEDALIQLRAYNSGSMNDVMIPLEAYYYNLFSDYSSYKDDTKDITRKHYPEECLVISSGGNEYCGTWVWDNETLERSLNNYYHPDYYVTSYLENFLDDSGYLSINGKKATIFEYIQENEPEIRKTFQELDRIASLDYYLPNNEILNLIPAYLQGYTRASVIALQYYIYQEDWDMVMFIIKLNYKIVDIFNTTGSFICQLISLVIQGIMDGGINSYTELFPKDFRNELSEWYSTKIYDKNEMYDKLMKGEYIMWNWARDNNILSGDGNGEPMYQFLFHFPFFSAKEINNMMNYSYYSLWKEPDNDSIGEMIDNLLYIKSLYNRYGKEPYSALMPRMHTVLYRMDEDIYHKETIVKNLKDGEIRVRFNKNDYEYNYTEFEKKLIPTFKEINKEAIKEYSDIINPCLGKDIIDSNNDSESSLDIYKNMCSEALSKINEQEDDKFGLKEILAKMAQLRIDYYNNYMDFDSCRVIRQGDSGDFCREMFFTNGDEILNLMKVSDSKFLEVLEDVKSEIKGIDIDEYFYIPEYFYDNNSEVNNIEINNEKTDEIELDDNSILESGNSEIIKTIEKIIEYSNIVEPCFGKDIIDPKYSVGIYHDEFEEACLKTLKELKEQENDNFGLKEILIEVTKSLINHSKFEVKADACWLEDGAIPRACDEIFNKEEELIDKVKDNYKKLSNILDNIEDEYQGINMDAYFYIPYKKINDDSNLLILSFNVDEEKAKQILDELRLQESKNNN